MSWVENFLKINKRGGTSIRDQRVVYLNDFEKCLKASKAGMYADDTQVSLASSSVDELVRKA